MITAGSRQNLQVCVQISVGFPLHTVFKWWSVINPQWFSTRNFNSMTVHVSLMTTLRFWFRWSQGNNTAQMQLHYASFAWFSATQIQPRQMCQTRCITSNLSTETLNKNLFSDYYVQNSIVLPLPLKRLPKFAIIQQHSTRSNIEGSFVWTYHFLFNVLIKIHSKRTGCKEICTEVYLQIRIF